MAEGLSNPKGPLGYLALKKTAGQASPAIGTQFSFMVNSVQPRNPSNRQYMTPVNTAFVSSIRIAGKKTPAISLVTVLKTSFWTGSTGLNMVSDFIGLATSFLDTNNNTSEYGIKVFDGQQPRVFDGCKCTNMQLYYTAPAGGVVFSTTWVAIYGDSEKGTPTSFSAVTVDGGDLIDITNIAWTGADNVYDATLMFSRAQQRQMASDSTLYATSVESGPLAGALVLNQNANASATVPSSSATLKIGTTPNGIQFAMNLSKNEYVEDVIPALLGQSNHFELWNSGTSFVTASTF